MQSLDRGEKNVNIWEASIEDKTIIEVCNNILNYFSSNSDGQDKDGNIKFATLNGLVEKLTPAEHIPSTLELSIDTSPNPEIDFKFSQTHPTPMRC